MKNYLIVIDCQNDFINGPLGTPEAKAIIPNIKAKIDMALKNEDWEVIFTRDSHRANYLETSEGKHLPVKHCIYGTPGWCVVDELNHPECKHINKPTFGYTNWEAWIDPDTEVIELVGVCTDICVVSNCLILKALYPEATIAVDASCCAGVTPEKHKAALEVMKSCQIEVYND